MTEDIVDPVTLVEDACPEGTHRIVESGDGYRICERCGLSVDTIQNWKVHRITEEEYHLDGENSV